MRELGLALLGIEAMLYMYLYIYKYR